MAWDGNWNLDPPPGMQGLRDDLPLRIYVRHMLHWRQEGATYFVTFRLSDSIPESRRHELERLKSDWEAKHRGTQDKQLLEELARMVFERIEDWLDQGTGSCVLKESRFSLLVHQSMQHFHGQHYELGASVVMPNHVHCIIRPLAKAKKELEVGNPLPQDAFTSLSDRTADFGRMRVTIGSSAMRNIFGDASNTLETIPRRLGCPV